MYTCVLDDSRKELRKLLFTRCEKTEINLRKYKILGGVYHIDLIYQPPQPKDMRGNIFLTTRMYCFKPISIIKLKQKIKKNFIS